MVAHSIGIIAIQAGSGRRVFNARPGEARDALAAIEATSRETLSGLRRAEPEPRVLAGTAGPGARPGRHRPASRHARTDQCRVPIGQQDGQLSIEVTDSGREVMFPAVPDARCTPGQVWQTGWRGGSAGVGSPP